MKQLLAAATDRRLPAADWLAPHLPVAAEDRLVGGELFEADGAARVELLGANADLRAKAELVAVRETRRGVHEDARRVDFASKSLRRPVIAGDDRLRVAGAISLDVIKRLIQRIDYADREYRAEELGREVLLGGGCGGRDDGQRLRAAANFEARLDEPHCQAGQQPSRDGLVNQQRLHRVACRWARYLCVESDLARHIDLGGGVDVGVAVSAERREDRHARILKHALLQRLAAARYQHVH